MISVWDPVITAEIIMKHDNLPSFLLISALSSSSSILVFPAQACPALTELHRSFAINSRRSTVADPCKFCQPWQCSHRRASSPSVSRECVNALQSNEARWLLAYYGATWQKLQNPQYYPTHSFPPTLIIVLFLKLYNLIFSSEPKRQELSSSQSDCTQFAGQMYFAHSRGSGE